MDDLINLEKARKIKEEFKWDLGEITKAKPEHKSGEQKCAIENIKKFYEGQEKVIKLFGSYSEIASEAKYKAKHRKGLKISTPKQML